MKKMKELVEKLFHNHVMRYLFFGGMTTLVNLVTYYVLRQFAHMSLTAANLISIIAAIIFAFVTNSRFVFDSGASTAREHIQEFLKFVSARGVSMVVELVGVWLFAYLGMNDFLGKCITQFVVIVLNYIFSRFFVFRKQ